MTMMKPWYAMVKSFLDSLIVRKFLWNMYNLHILCLKKDSLLVKNLVQAKYKILFQHDAYIIKNGARKVITKFFWHDDFHKSKKITK